MANYTPPDDVWKLIHLLAENTRAGKISWETIRSGMYAYRTLNGAVTFGSISTRDIGSPFRFSVLTADGTQLEAYEAPSEDTAIVFDTALESLWHAIRNMERERTVAPIINSIIDDLPVKDGPLPPKEVPARDDLDELPF